MLLLSVRSEGVEVRRGAGSVGCTRPVPAVGVGALVVPCAADIVALPRRWLRMGDRGQGEREDQRAGHSRRGQSLVAQWTTATTNNAAPAQNWY